VRRLRPRARPVRLHNGRRVRMTEPRHDLIAHIREQIDTPEKAEAYANKKKATLAMRIWAASVGAPHLTDDEEEEK